LVIEEIAFHDAALVSLLIPPSVVTLGDKCFSRCRGLHLIDFGAGSKLLDVESSIFDDTERVKGIAISATMLESFKRAVRDKVIGE
jgi:hypothetical protein